MLQNLATILLNLFQNLIRKQTKNELEKEVKMVSLPAEKSSVTVGVINWADPTSKISKYFTVKEALYLPSWQVLHIPSEEEQKSILIMAKKMDLIREYLGMPIHIECWIRPILNNPISPNNGKDYNTFVKGSKVSGHKIGLAVDWSVKNIKCDEIRNKLIPKLEEFDIRMEDLPKSNWVHVDCKKPISGRFFKP